MCRRAGCDRKRPHQNQPYIKGYHLHCPPQLRVNIVLLCDRLAEKMINYQGFRNGQCRLLLNFHQTCRQTKAKEAAAAAAKEFLFFFATALKINIPLLHYFEENKNKKKIPYLANKTHYATFSSIALRVNNFLLYCSTT